MRKRGPLKSAQANSSTGIAGVHLYVVGTRYRRGRTTYCYERIVVAASYTDEHGRPQVKRWIVGGNRTEAEGMALAKRFRDHGVTRTERALRKLGKIK